MKTWAIKEFSVSAPALQQTKRSSKDDRKHASGRLHLKSNVASSLVLQFWMVKFHRVDGKIDGERP